MRITVSDKIQRLASRIAKQVAQYGNSRDSWARDGTFHSVHHRVSDNTLKTPEDVEKHLGLQVIGMIPIFEQVDK